MSLFVFDIPSGVSPFTCIRSRSMPDSILGSWIQHVPPGIFVRTKAEAARSLLSTKRDKSLYTFAAEPTIPTATFIQPKSSAKHWKPSRLGTKTSPSFRKYLACPQWPQSRVNRKPLCSSWTSLYNHHTGQAPSTFAVVLRLHRRL